MVSAKTLDEGAWIDAAVQAILEGGIGAVAVEPLARALGVTKGSFYWHFRDRDALLHAVVDKWAGRTAALIAEVRGIAAPGDRIIALIHAVFSSPEGVRSMRAMGTLATHPTVGTRVKEVAAERQQFLADCFAEMGLKGRRAQATARVVHAATLGVGELDALGIGFTSASEQKAYVEDLVRFVHSAAEKAPNQYV